MLEEFCLHKKSVQDVVVVSWLLVHIELGWFGGVGRLLIEHVKTNN
jgi:hypothetical protein